MNLLVKYMGYYSYTVCDYVIGLNEGNWELFKWAYYGRH